MVGVRIDAFIPAKYKQFRLVSENNVDIETAVFSYKEIRLHTDVLKYFCSKSTLTFFEISIVRAREFMSIWNKENINRNNV